MSASKFLKGWVSRLACENDFRIKHLCDSIQYLIVYFNTLQELLISENNSLFFIIYNGHTYSVNRFFSQAILFLTSFGKKQWVTNFSS